MSYHAGRFQAPRGANGAPSGSCSMVDSLCIPQRQYETDGWCVSRLFFPTDTSTAEYRRSFDKLAISLEEHHCVHPSSSYQCQVSDQLPPNCHHSCFDIQVTSLVIRFCGHYSAQVAFCPCKPLRMLLWQTHIFSTGELIEATGRLAHHQVNDVAGVR